MCGIAGFLDTTQSTNQPAFFEAIGRMIAPLRHRGPDDAGTWCDAAAGIALGQRRLSIIDVSPEGRQPMFSVTGRYVLVFNGEIYNYKAIRAELDRLSSSQWRGHSDTEVLLAAIERWGVAGSISRTVGMFALAVFDRQARKLFLVRDRVGEKPLYYGLVGTTVLFGSELKALRAYPDWEGNVDRSSLALYMERNCVGGARSIYTNVRKLLPGTILEIDATQRLTSFDELDARPYWSMAEVIGKGKVEQFAGGDGDAVDALDKLLRRAVREQMLATDVPLGAFLSGGIDSSTVVALMQQESTRPVRTFTIGFNERGYDEAKHAKAVAQLLGTEHTELYVSPQQARDVIPMLPAMYDEPFADSSQIPTFLVAKMARQYVTVALSGDAGDEVFGGYTRYSTGLNTWRAVSPLPAPIRWMMARGITALPVSVWDRAFAPAQLLLPSTLRQSGAGDKLHKFAQVLSSRDERGFYNSLISHWKIPVVIGATPTNGDHRFAHDLALDFTEWMMYADTMAYLPDDILVKVDRAAMAVSLETRVPFLDHRVVEFAWTLPVRMRIRDGKGKWLVRQLLNRYVPPSLTERPKTGFGIPLADWLRNELRDWAEELLQQNRLEQEGFFHPAEIRRKWTEHLSGRRNWQYLIWDVLMFQAWLASQRSETRVPAGASQ